MFTLLMIGTALLAILFLGVILFGTLRPDRGRVKCPLCKSGIIPLPMARGDTLRLWDGSGRYILRELTSSAPKGTTANTCYNCGYIISTEE